MFLSASVIAVTTALATSAFADDATTTTSTDPEVIVTGTRATGVKAADSAAPIQVIGSVALHQVGQPDLTQALAQTVPSFNENMYGADAAALTLQAALRGVSPNDTLVLVNGKRRHTTGNLAVDGGSPYSGSASTDLGLIPVGAIDHVEVLTDGAAAQYGSDAIAGVVNLILKKSNSGGAVTGTTGQYMGGDGFSAAASYNQGIALGDAGFLNLTFEERYHEHSRQGGGDRRLVSATGTSVATGFTGTQAPLVPGYPNVNNIFGDPAYNVYNLFYNAGYEFGPNLEVYSFGSYSHRNAQAFENYRVPSKVSGVTKPIAPATVGTTVFPYPLGFSPSEGISEDDYSFTFGIKGTVGGWDWDLATTYGQDSDKIYTLHSSVASLFADLQSTSTTPISFPLSNYYDGTFANAEWNASLDVDKTFAIGMASPLNLAFGFETRQDTFTLTAGEAASYYKEGAQSFTGYDPTNAGSHSRTNYSGYIDLSADVAKGFHVDLAGRYEHYSDFGSTTVGKLTARYDFNPMIAIRGTVSTGFRAPTLAEEYYSGTNVAPSFAEVQLPPNSVPATVAGFGPLKPEKSTNYSIGFVAHPMEHMQITLDAYEIDIKDRIVVTGFIYGSYLSGGTNYVISQAVLNAIAAHGNTLDTGISYAGIAVFTNGVDTRTRGIELTANYASDFGDMGHVDWTVGLNYNENTITKIKALPAADAFTPPTGNPAGLPSQTSLLSPSALSALTTATPKEKAVLGAYWTIGRWSVNLRETIYGPSSLLSTVGATTTNLVIDTTAITDLNVGVNIFKNLKLDVGANNLFDTKPPLVPNLPSGRPASGSNVYNVPMTFSPFGINGGYYYTRLTFTF